MTNAIAKTTSSISEYLRQPENLARFTDLLGTEGKSYVQSVIIAVSSNDQLMTCTPRSVMRAALRAASLELSCDPALKQAWLISYNRKVKNKNGEETWVKEAQFQPLYMGLHTLAMRTNKYLIINVAPIYEGEKVYENTTTGLHDVEYDTGIVGQPASYNLAYRRDVTVRRSQNKKVIGWLGYFETRKGFKKSVYMSCEEISEWAQEYSKGYEDKNSPWQDPKKRPTMEMKTVLRALLRWADLSGTESGKLKEAIEADEEPIDATVVSSAEDEDPNNPDPIDDKTWKAFEALRDQAKTNKVPYQDVNRKTNTRTELLLYMQELEAELKARE